MIKQVGVFGIGVAAGALAVTLLSGGGWHGRDPAEALPDRSAESPTRRYVLMVTEGSDGSARVRQFSILDRGSPSGQTVAFACPDRFRTRDRLHFLWGEGDRVWVYSADLGTFFWEPVGDGSWRKQILAAAKSPPSVPAALRRLVSTLP